LVPETRVFFFSSKIQLPKKKEEHSMMEEGCEQEKFEGTDQNEPPKKKVSCS